jgi:hypothetical protein
MGDASDSTDTAASRGRPKPSLRVVAGDDAAVPERDPHPDWLAEARALARKMGEPGFAPGVDLSLTTTWRRWSQLTRLIGSTPAATLAGAVAQLEMVQDELARQNDLSNAARGGFRAAMATLKQVTIPGPGPRPAA